MDRGEEGKKNDEAKGVEDEKQQDAEALDPAPPSPAAAQQTPMEERFDQMCLTSPVAHVLEPHISPPMTTQDAAEPHDVAEMDLPSPAQLAPILEPLLSPLIMTQDAAEPHYVAEMPPAGEDRRESSSASQPSSGHTHTHPPTHPPFQGGGGVTYERLEVLLQRLEESSRHSDDAVHFLRRRAEIEEVYAKSLRRLYEETAEAKVE